MPDYINSVKEDGFYGWPWYYMGAHRDPRLALPCADGTAGNMNLGGAADRRAGRHLQAP